MGRRIILIAVLIVVFSHFALVLQSLRIEESIHRFEDVQKASAVRLFRGVMSSAEASREAWKNLHAENETLSQKLSKQYSSLRTENEHFRRQLGSLLAQQENLVLKMQERIPTRSLPAEENPVVRKLLDRGIRLYREQDYIHAASELSDVLVLAPDSTEAKLYSNAALFKSNPLDSRIYKPVETSLHEVLAVHPDSIAALEVLAEISTEREEWNRAWGYYSRLCVLDPENAEYARRMVSLCFNNGALQDASVELSRLLELEPENPVYLYYSGCCAEENGNLGEAEALFRKSLAADSEYQPARLAAARLNIEGGRFTAAEELLSAPALRDSFEAKLLLAECRSSQDFRTAALRLWREAIRLLPLNTGSDRQKAAGCCRRMAEVYLKQGETGAAERAVEEGLSYCSTDALLLLKAKLYRAAGHLSAARLILASLTAETSADSGPEVAEARRLLTEWVTK